MYIAKALVICVKEKKSKYFMESTMNANVKQVAGGDSNKPIVSSLKSNQGHYKM